MFSDFTSLRGKKNDACNMSSAREAKPKF